MLDIIIFSFLSLVGALIANKMLKVPGGRLIGPIFILAFVKITGMELIVPDYLKTVFSIILGVFLGLKIQKNTLQQLNILVKPSITIIGWYIFITMIYGFLLVKITLLDNITAFLAVIPGGIAEVNILAMDYKANLALITFFQMARLFTIVVFVPVILKYLSVENNGEKLTAEKKTEIQKVNNFSWIVYFVIGITGGVIFRYLNIPAGGLIGAFIFTAVFNLIDFKQIDNPPIYLYNASQIGMGGIIGIGFSRNTLINLDKLVFPVFTLTLLIILNSFILAWILKKLYKWNLITSFISIVPGGFAPMLLIADEVKADITIVSTLQLVRLLTAVVIIPFIYAFLF